MKTDRNRIAKEDSRVLEQNDSQISLQTKQIKQPTTENRPLNLVAPFGLIRSSRVKND